MKVVDAAALGDAGYVVEREKGFACEIVCRYNVMVHHSKSNHCALLCALLQCYCAELEAFVENGIECSLRVCVCVIKTVKYKKR